MVMTGAMMTAWRRGLEKAGMRSNGPRFGVAFITIPRSPSTGVKMKRGN